MAQQIEIPQFVFKKKKKFRIRIIWTYVKKYAKSVTQLHLQPKNQVDV